MRTLSQKLQESSVCIAGPRTVVLGQFSIRERFQTTLYIAEQTLSPRPVTPVFSHVNDLEALNPNHFLLGNKNFCTMHREFC